MHETLMIQKPYIRLGDALKYAACCQSGGEAKCAVQAGEVRVDGRVVFERGRKLTPGQVVTYKGKRIAIEKQERLKGKRYD
jgi:ribosome-associated protein